MNNSELVQEFKEKYLVLAKKHGLPSFEELNTEFLLEDFIQFKGYVPQLVLRAVRNILVDHFYQWVNFLHNFVFPNQQSLIYMSEHNYLTEEDKAHIETIINRLMLVNRYNIKLDIDKNEEKDALFIKEKYAEWLQWKSELIVITDKLEDFWKKKN
ncbi:hypothetical protein C4573_02310 [Candidatus Woesearchaeota archaeon]|nr:MAG: hypothetical protein C4573_02310 [Candidatus Woesearchaeota archaeon]